jgi:alkylhydroperoxidase family enzyme
VTGNFLGEPPLTPEAQALYDEDLAEDGYVGSGARLWAYQPEAVRELFALMSRAYRASGLTFRQCAILVTATASTLGDSACSMAWGGKLANASDPALAAAVLTGTDTGLTEQDRALADWARKVVRDPNATTAADVQVLRDCGLDDGQIFAVTTYIAYIALRLAFSTVNDALGLHPDAQLAQSLPSAILDAVTYGRPADS